MDVKDVALLHTAALTNSQIQNERIIAFAAPFAWNDILAILRRARPDQSTIPEDIPNEGKCLTKVANTRGEGILRALGRSGWTGLEEAIMENIKHT